MRILFIDNNSKAQIQGLINPNLDATQAAVALQSLQASNPHVNLQKLQPGVVLVVPDTPSFQASASSSTAAGPLDDFLALARGALAGAAKSIVDGNSARSAQRQAVAAALQSATAAHVGQADANLQQQMAEATQALNQEQLQDEQAAKDFASANDEVLARLSELNKLLG